MTERERILDRIGRFKNSVVMHRHKMTEYPTGSQGHTYHSIMADKLENQIIEFEEELSKLEVQEEVLGDKQIHYTNKCKEYKESELGSIIDGRKYKPRKKQNANLGQVTLDDIKKWEVKNNE